MAKKIIKPIKTRNEPARTEPFSKVSAPSPIPLQQVFNFPQRTKYIILAVIGFIFYANSIPNKYAHDDAISITQNSYVKMGISGIGKILTNDSWASYYASLGGDPKQQGLGGRYRPLSEVIFAIEQTIFGDSDLLPHIRHLVNVIGYIVCLLAIFYFLDKFLLRKMPGGSDCAFLATILFAIHPIHTEVVANIKSFDEILSLTFMMLTFIFSLKYLKEKKIKLLLLGCICFFCSLLAKEYAISLIFFIPLLFYLLEGKKPFDAAIATIPYIGVVIIYIAMRYNAVGFNSSGKGADILTNPYFYATSAQRVATEWFVMGKYIKLLFFPYPLTADYSYNVIPYRNFSDILVWFSILAYIAIGVWGVALFLKKSVLTFPVSFFLIILLLISNLIMPLGGTMGERLAFHSSIGFTVILSYFFLKAIKKLPVQKKRIIIMSVVSVLSVVCFGETVVRNSNWYDTDTLFIHDANIVPESALATNNASYAYLTMCEKDYGKKDIADANRCLDSARKYAYKALKIYKNYVAGYLNLGAVYFHLENPDSAKYCWDMVGKLFPNHPSLKAKYAILIPTYYNNGIALAHSGDFQGGFRDLRIAASMSDTNADIWYNMGGIYFTIKRYDSARYCWLKTLKIKPGDANSLSGLKAIEGINKEGK